MRFEVTGGVARVLDVEDRLVEQAGEHVEADAGLARFRFGQREVSRASEVAEEVALALGAVGVERGDFRRHLPEDAIDRRLERCRPGQQPSRELVQILGQHAQLRSILLGAEQPLELPEQRCST